MWAFPPRDVGEPTEAPGAPSGQSQGHRSTERHRPSQQPLMTAPFARALGRQFRRPFFPPYASGASQLSHEEGRTPFLRENT